MTSLQDTPDAATWARLSPMLDEALDLPALERAAWLAALRLRAPQDAERLQGLLDNHDAAARADFLAGMAHHANAPPAAGHRLGPWVIEAPLGEGGMASVWLARRSDGRHDGHAAIKLMHGRLHSSRARQRFEGEGRILARLEHRHIARLLDAGVAADGPDGQSGQPYLVLELVRGQPIDRWCDERRLDIDARLRLFVDVALAVAAAHTQLVVHRDLKPGNVMVDDQGQVKLLDFGIARLLDESEDGVPQDITRTGQRAFTPAWAAPEQMRGDPVSTATDVWALGVLLCHLLTGRHPSALPWTSDLTAWMHAAALPDIKRPSQLASQGEEAATLAAVRGLPPPRLAKRLQGDLDQIVLRALAEEPGRRYTSAQALAEDVQRHLRNEPVSAVADTMGYRATKFVRRNRGAVAAGLLTATAIVAGVIGTATQAHRATLEAARANEEREAAIGQMQMATGVTDFFQLLLRDVAEGGEGGVRKQLDRARVLVRDTTFRYPLAKAAVFQQLAGRYGEADDLSSAVAMLDEAIKIVQTLPTRARRESSMVPLLCERASFMNDLGLDADGINVLNQAQALMDAGAYVEVDARAECLAVRSYLSSALGQHAQAVAAARDAIRVLEAEAGGLTGFGVVAYTSALDRALLLAGRYAEAWPLAEKIYNDTLTSEGLNSMAALRLANKLAHLKRVGGQPLEALPLTQRDLALMEQLMGKKDGDALTLYEHGATLLALGRHADAAAWLTRAADTARARNDVSNAKRTELAAVQALLAAGQTAQAQRRFQAAQAQWDEAARSRSPQHVEFLRMQALLAAQAGELTTARALLVGAATAATARSGPEHPDRLALELTQGEMALTASDAPAALAHAEQAVAAARRAALNAQRSSGVGQALWLQARAEAALQRPTAATTAAAALLHLAPTLGDTHPLAQAAQRAAVQR